jgi:ribonuclease HII
LNPSGDILCGLDEAGRGPLAGPVCAAAVILPPDFPVEVLNDSKKLSATEREKARLVIYSQALAFGIGWATAAEIDEINIHKASLLAMKRAFEEMIRNSEIGDANFSGCRAIADGLFIPELPVPCEPLVKADTIVPAVMAASILAKTARDRLMEYYGLFYPEYGYEKHKGYPTKAHREAILRWGPSPIQRLSFSPHLFKTTENTE